MEEEKQKPVQRDYLSEAIKIAEGGAVKVIRREHVKALFDAYIAVCGQHSQLKDSLRNIATQAMKMRAVKGLPPVGPPSPVTEKQGDENGNAS